MTAGIWTMQESHVANLVILMLLVLYSPPTLVLEVVKSGWTMSTVLEVKIPLRIARTMDGVHITAVTMKMHLSFVQVSTRVVPSSKLHMLHLCDTCLI